MILIATWMVQPALYAVSPKVTAVPKDITPARVSSRAPWGHGAWSRPAAVTVIVVAVVGAA